MKVLFVCSGNSYSGISPVVKNQGDSLELAGININYFTINNKGVKGYLKAIKELRKHLKHQNYDIIHAHYSLSGFVAALAKTKPLVVSLMGSDVKAKKWYRIIIYMFYRFFWDKCIVKTLDMKKSLGFKNIIIVPNGVDTKKFKPEIKEEAQQLLGWNQSKIHLLFAANPNRPEKNYNLTESAYQKIKTENTELHYLENIDNKDMPVYYNASDVVVLSSLWEGSPNAIKEAMACSRPIVSTNVGDVEWLFGNESGQFIADFDENEFAHKLISALEFSERHPKTKGKERIIALEIDSESITNRIISIYKAVLNESTFK